MPIYTVKIKANLRPDEPLTAITKAAILADLAKVLRKYNGGGGGKIVEVDMEVSHDSESR